MNPILRTALLFALLASPVAGRAGEFNTTCNFATDALAACGDNFGDVVSERFTERFPADKYQLFVYSNVETNPAGDMLAYAVAGVVLKGSHDFPKQRFQTSRVRGKGEYDADALGEEELGVARDAVAFLMETCGQTPDCAVYAPWDAAAPAVEPVDASHD